MGRAQVCLKKSEASKGSGTCEEGSYSWSLSVKKCQDQASPTQRRKLPISIPHLCAHRCFFFDWSTCPYMAGQKAVATTWTTFLAQGWLNACKMKMPFFLLRLSNVSLLVEKPKKGIMTRIEERGAQTKTIGRGEGRGRWERMGFYVLYIWITMPKKRLSCIISTRLGAMSSSSSGSRLIYYYFCGSWTQVINFQTKKSLSKCDQSQAWRARTRPIQIGLGKERGKNESLYGRLTYGKMSNLLAVGEWAPWLDWFCIHENNQRSIH